MPKITKTIPLFIYNINKYNNYFNKTQLTTLTTININMENIKIQH